MAFHQQQNIKTFKYDWKLIDRNCPKYGMCPVYGELILYHIRYKMTWGVRPTYIVFTTGLGRRFVNK